VCAGPPPPGAPLTAAARALHARWGLGDDAWLARRGEDARACAELGAEALWLDVPDAPYRGYASAAEIFDGAVDPALAADVASALVACWRRTADARVYLPLGVGDHVDHRLVAAAGPALLAAGAAVRYYADLPYAALGDALAARLRDAPGPLRVEREDIAPWLPRRIAAVLAYRSQLSSLFAPAGLVASSPADAIAAWARAAAGLDAASDPAAAAERFFVPSGPAAPGPPAPLDPPTPPARHGA
jgi:hypothetical protein